MISLNPDLLSRYFDHQTFDIAAITFTWNAQKDASKKVQITRRVSHLLLPNGSATLAMEHPLYSGEKSVSINYELSNPPVAHATFSLNNKPVLKTTAQVDLAKKTVELKLNYPADLSDNHYRILADFHDENVWNVTAKDSHNSSVFHHITLLKSHQNLLQNIMWDRSVFRSIGVSIEYATDRGCNVVY